ncbi:hypothetical protein BJY01DRAFT_242420 [Aspergillus pseudoustus]|uniref:4Fe-4S ferredoxin-type domain-containing protein n=1 Tax=Aspergillus pseudoustus TaxID=1810923 RepID=A0ABR4KYI8_9EURO
MARLSLLTLASCLALAWALPQPQNVCTTVCRPVKPECPEGQEAGGSEDCWGCCQPIVARTDVCATVCRPEKPECPEGEEAGGVEGCWGCCQPIETDVCLAVCIPEKPECPAGEAPTGSEAGKIVLWCWSLRVLTSLRVAGDVVNLFRRSSLLMTFALSSVAPRNPNALLARLQPVLRAAGAAANQSSATYVLLSVSLRNRNVLKARRRPAQRVAGDVANLLRKKLLSMLKGEKTSSSMAYSDFQ